LVLLQPRLETLPLAVDTALGYPDATENGETYEVEMINSERIRVGNTVTVTKKGDPHLGKTGTVVKLTMVSGSSKVACQVDIGTSTTREYLESELARVPLPVGVMGARLSCERCGSILFFVEATFWSRDSEKRHKVEPELRSTNCSHVTSLANTLRLLESEIEEKTGNREQSTLDDQQRRAGKTA